MPTDRFLIRNRNSSISFIRQTWLLIQQSKIVGLEMTNKTANLILNKNWTAYEV